jgi:hypothetical protein
MGIANRGLGTTEFALEVLQSGQQRFGCQVRARLERHHCIDEIGRIRRAVDRARPPQRRAPEVVRRECLQARHRLANDGQRVTPVGAQRHERQPRHPGFTV